MCISSDLALSARLIEGANLQRIRNLIQLKRYINSQNHFWHVPRSPYSMVNIIKQNADGPHFMLNRLKIAHIINLAGVKSHFCHICERKRESRRPVQCFISNVQYLLCVRVKVHQIDDFFRFAFIHSNLTVGSLLHFI